MRGVTKLLTLAVFAALCAAVAGNAFAAPRPPVLTPLGGTAALAGCGADTTIASGFNGMSVPAGSTMWFSSVVKPRFPVPSGSFSIRFTNQTITVGSLTLPVPDGTVNFSTTATLATTTFDTATNSWTTTMPTGIMMSGTTFLSALSYPLPADLPGGLSPVTWRGTLYSTAPLSVSWKWSAAAYSSFGSTYNSLGVKPTDDATHSAYLNSDMAGTPENFKSLVVPGGRGNGGTNYTGSVTPTQMQAIGCPVPTVTTTASPDVTLGGQISDSAFLSGTTSSPAATGTIAFKLYGPNDATCSGSPAYTRTVGVAGGGNYASGGFTPSAVGTYRWVATYSGDSSNASATSACGDPAETVIVSAANAGDTTPPTCVLAGFSDSNRTIHVMVGDTGSGLASVVPVTTNATPAIPGFASGSTAPIDVSATKIDAGSTAFLKLTVTDVAGNVTVCDPVVPGIATRTLHRGVQQIGGLTAMQSRITIRNVRHGLSRVVVTVNGVRFDLRLRPGATRRIDVFPAMRARGRNIVAIRGFGRAHGTASFTISA